MSSTTNNQVYNHQLKGKSSVFIDNADIERLLKSKSTKYNNSNKSLNTILDKLYYSFTSVKCLIKEGDDSKKIKYGKDSCILINNNQALTNKVTFQGREYNGIIEIKNFSKSRVLYKGYIIKFRNDNEILDVEFEKKYILHPSINVLNPKESKYIHIKIFEREMFNENDENDKNSDDNSRLSKMNIKIIFEIVELKDKLYTSMNNNDIKDNFLNRNEYQLNFMNLMTELRLQTKLNPSIRQRSMSNQNSKTINEFQKFKNYNRNNNQDYNQYISQNPLYIINNKAYNQAIKKSSEDNKKFQYNLTVLSLILIEYENLKGEEKIYEKVINEIYHKAKSVINPVYETNKTLLKTKKLNVLNKKINKFHLLYKDLYDKAIENEKIYSDLCSEYHLKKINIIDDYNLKNKNKNNVLILYKFFFYIVILLFGGIVGYVLKGVCKYI